MALGNSYTSNFWEPFAIAILTNPKNVGKKSSQNGLRMHLKLLPHQLPPIFTNISPPISHIGKNQKLRIVCYFSLFPRARPVCSTYSAQGPPPQGLPTYVAASFEEALNEEQPLLKGERDQDRRLIWSSSSICYMYWGMGGWGYWGIGGWDTSCYLGLNSRYWGMGEWGFGV